MNRLDAAQVEQLEEIGVYLQAIREKQGKSLDEIATKTFIPLRLLKAIETGNAHPLPEPVFVQGFIRRYAEALGLDGKDLCQRFSVEAAPVAPPSPATADVALADSSPAQTPSTPSGEPIAPPAAGPWMDSTPSASDHRPNWVPAYVVGGVIVLIGLGYTIAGQWRPPAKAPALPEALTEPAVPPQSPLAAPETPTFVSPTVAARPTVASAAPDVSSPSPQPSPVANGEPVVVKLNFQGTSWVEVTVDGEVVFEGTLDAGTQRTWSGKKQVTIVAGNAGAVFVSYNQGQAVPMGELGEVRERSFPLASTTQTVEAAP
ncbi:RodZ domain-containing protein [Trichothermofontia sp.]